MPDHDALFLPPVPAAVPATPRVDLAEPPGGGRADITAAPVGGILWIDSACCPPSQLRLHNKTRYRYGCQHLPAIQRGLLQYQVRDQAGPALASRLGIDVTNPLDTLGGLSRALAVASLRLRIYECVFRYIRADLTQTSTYVGALMRWYLGPDSPRRPRRAASTCCVS